MYEINVKYVDSKNKKHVVENVLVSDVCIDDIFRILENYNVSPNEED